ncbi:hypothetical protein CANCADRAFT_3750 [Tortispora caseinolytica NRRL Y-17796]|uniref:Ste50p n=1 Tax=Tortispora caseinolytica NRRL Y-17796 TaxID=767744 RepID=A0A1E4TBL8_9ASCO|nr:hypothetical protein CANCADRAFT_3750 [Tortispora caseinolytica NRRL Y-17796]
MDNLRAKSLSQWSLDDVSVYLSSLGLDQYLPLFKEHDVTGDVLIRLNHSLLREIGVVVVGDRLDILLGIYALKAAQNIPLLDDDFVPNDSQILTKERAQYELQARDNRIHTLELELKRLSDSHIRIREELLPLHKIFKDSKPLPTPGNTISAEITSNTSGFVSPNNTILRPSASNRHSAFYAQPYENPPKYSAVSSSSSITPTTPSSAPVESFQTQSPSRSTPPKSGASIADSITSSGSLAPHDSRTNMHVKSPDSAGPLSSPAQPHDTRRHMQGHSSSSTKLSGSNDAFKAFRVQESDPCYKVLPSVLRRYRVDDDWRKYALLVCYDEVERILGYDEKPLAIFKELQEAGLNPVFMLRHVDGGTPDQGLIVNSSTPGGVL